MLPHRRLLFTLTFLVALVLLPLGLAGRSDDLPHGMGDIVFDKAGFVGTLPMTTVICPIVQRPGQEAVAADLASLQREILKLGKLRGREFMLLSPNSQKPRLVEAPLPVLPEALRARGIRGDFGFWVLVSSAGQVDSLYCFSAPDRDAAGYIAETLGRWRFTPAERAGEKVPVLLQVFVPAPAP